MFRQTRTNAKLKITSNKSRIYPNDPNPKFKTAKQLSNNSGLDTNNTVTALAKLLGGLNQGIQHNTAQSGGMESLLRALQGGNHQRYLQDRETAFSNSARQDGNSILGHILGSKDASRSLAGRVEKETGISSSILKKMLPVVASLAMGALSKQSHSQGGALSQLLGGGQSSSAANSLLTSFLDTDNDGSVLDDDMSMAAKYLR